MRIYVNGVYRDMTAVEEAAYTAAQEQAAAAPVSDGERIAQLEEALELLLSGATE